MSQHAEKLGASILRRIVCITSSERLYFNGKPKTDLKTILTTVGIEIPSEFPIALCTFLKDKTHIHFDFKTPASDMSTIQKKLMQVSQALPPSFSSFPESKQENNIPNIIFNKLIETVKNLGGGLSEKNCKWKNPNNTGVSNKPLAISFFDELSFQSN